MWTPGSQRIICRRPKLYGSDINTAARAPSNPTMQPLRNLQNRGNTCWAASAVQALRALDAGKRMCVPDTCVPFRKALCDAEGVRRRFPPVSLG